MPVDHSARTGPDGEPVLLEHQDRRRWGPRLGLGAYGLQAAIADLGNA